jgi:hypothetical protein
MKFECKVVFGRSVPTVLTTGSSESLKPGFSEYRRAWNDFLFRADPLKISAANLWTPLFTVFALLYRVKAKRWVCLLYERAC